MMKPTPYDRTILAAVRALFAGEATPDQQVKAMEWIILNLCHVGQLSFVAESERVSCVNEGMRLVGLQLAKMREPEALAQLKIWEAETSKARSARATKAEKEDQ